jgi:hypothetical protein
MSLSWLYDAQTNAATVTYMILELVRTKWLVNENSCANALGESLEQSMIINKSPH